MTLTLELTPEEALRIENAKRQGLDVDSLLRGLIAALPPVVAAPEEPPFYATASPEEWADAFQAWTESHDRNTPILSDEAISRENIYGERG